MPEFCMALDMANAMAMVISTSQEKYLVYFRALKMLSKAMMTVTMQTQKNMSNFMPKRFSAQTRMAGSSPMAAPKIIIKRSMTVNQRFVGLSALSFCGFEASTMRKNDESPQFAMKLSSASNTRRSPS